MKCSDRMDVVEGLRYVIDALELSGGRVLRALLQQPLSVLPSDCERQWALVQAAKEVVEKVANRVRLEQLTHLFYQVQEIEKLLSSIGSKTICNDVELFQIKLFTSVITDVSALLADLSFDALKLPSLGSVFALLDPDCTGVASFYVYSSYSEPLAKARERLATHKARVDAATSVEWQEEATRLQIAVEQEEEVVRGALMARLVPYKEWLLNAYHLVGQIELVFAKAALAVKWNLCRPVAGEVLQFRGMFHPQIADRLEKEGHTFQPVDICLQEGPCLLTGANMSGKTVVLKTVALIQVMARLGFFVPAESAVVPVTEEIYLLVGDRQDSGRGLSSFAAEMLQLNCVFEAVGAGNSLLVLIDEPARTTNPKEGNALLCALTRFFAKYRVRSLISTHYTELPPDCRRLRVAGFDPERVKGTLDPKNMNDYMDYTVKEDEQGTVPMEAIRIARLLGVNEEFLSVAGDYLNLTK